MLRRARLRLVLLALSVCAASVVSCLSPPTEVLVIVDTNLPLDPNLHIDITSLDGAQMPVDAAITHQWTAFADGGLTALPASFAVVPSAEGPRNAVVSLRVEASSGGVVLRRWARFQLVPNQPQTLRIFLNSVCATDDRMCGTMPCSRQAFCEAQGDTCDENGDCIAVMVMTTPGLDASNPGMDASMSLDVPGDVVHCAAGDHACGTGCFANIDPRHCGASCTACAMPPHATATCNGSQCGAQCLTGFADCNGSLSDGCESDLSQAASCGACGNACSGATSLCVLNASTNQYSCQASCSGATPMLCGTSCTNLQTDPQHCGSCAHACATPSGGTAVCMNGACSTQCNTGTHLCSGACVLNTDPNHCGTSCMVCPTPTNGSAACSNGTCVDICDTGTHSCNGTCVSNNDVNTCGANCTPCPAPANATANCTSGVCGWTCNGGFQSCGGSCVDVSSDANNCGSCGNSCRSGGCQGGTCVGFAGVYADTTGCVECNNDPISGGCGCPSGAFPALNSFDILNDCNSTLPSAVMYVCESSTLDSQAFGGMYQVDDPVNCGTGCHWSNSYTGGCSCPAGTSAFQLRAIRQTSCGQIGSRIYYCAPPAPVGDFGGFYQLDDPVTGGLGCRNANPYTGGCSCPGGYGGSTIRAIVDTSGGAIGSLIYQCTR